MPVRRGDRVVGHFVLVSATRLSYPTREQRRVAMVLADRVAVLPQADVA